MGRFARWGTILCLVFLILVVLLALKSTGQNVTLEEWLTLAPLFLVSSVLLGGGFGAYIYLDLLENNPAFREAEELRKATARAMKEFRGRRKR